MYMFISFVFLYLKDNKIILLLKWLIQLFDLNLMEYIWFLNKKKFSVNFMFLSQLINYMIKLENMILFFLDDNFICYKVVFMVFEIGVLSLIGF